jgi:hypothetical protein
MLVASANILLLIGFVACVALSINLRSWWPYCMLVVFYAIGRVWIAKKGQLIEAHGPRGLSIVWLLVLIAFVILLTKFSMR